MREYPTVIKKDLENQIELLTNFANAKGWIVNEIPKNFGS